MSLLQHFARHLHAHGLSANHRVAIAVSGGSDSLALALLTAWWQGRGAEVLQLMLQTQRQSMLRRRAITTLPLKCRRNTLAACCC